MASSPRRLVAAASDPAWTVHLLHGPPSL